MTRVACIGECMIELREGADGRLSRGWGGDTLNTAVYLARLGIPVDYVTALGDDPWSEEMLAGWAAEGVGTGAVRRVPGRVPGLYVIQTDARGERRFSYWRDSAPARDLFVLPDADALVAELAGYDLLYVSGITLSLYGGDGRAGLFEALAACRARGGRVVFDTNFRPRGWPDREVARAAYRAAIGSSDVLLASVEDLEQLFGEGWEPVFFETSGPRERVLKHAEPAARVIAEGFDGIVPTAVVAAVDTTAAGDSFAAGYLAARLHERAPAAAAEAGHRLAGAVVLHPGAVIPMSGMPEGLRFGSPVPR